MKIKYENEEYKSIEDFMEVIFRKKLPKMWIHQLCQAEEEFDHVDLDEFPPERSRGVMVNGVLVQFYDDVHQDIINLESKDDPISVWMDTNELYGIEDHFRARLVSDNHIIMYDDYIDDQTLSNLE